MTYYIDPGTSKGCAVAVFGATGFPLTRSRYAPLVGLGIWHTEHGFTRTWGVMGTSAAVWEKPRAYPQQLRGPRGAATANDLIDLTDAGSACANVLGWGRGGVRSVRPAEWKKQLDKPAHHLRVFRVLTGAELNLVAQAYAETTRLPKGFGGHPLDHLIAYVQDAARAIGRHQKVSYKAAITDLLDAIALGLSQEGRLVI